MSVARSRLFWCFCAGLIFCAAAAGCGSSETPQETAKTADVATATADDQETSLPLLAIPGKAAAPAKAASPSKTAGPAKSTAPNKAAPSKAVTPSKPGSDDEVDPDDDPEDIESDKEDMAEEQNAVAPKAGTPEALVYEASKLFLQAPPKTEDVAVLKKHRKEKNEKIVKLSQQAIALTHKDRAKETVFNQAVHNLMEARMQLALAGDAEQIELLNEDAVALVKRSPKSAAAAEAAHAQVNLMYGLAKSAPADDAKWLIEFAAAARYFAENFPAEERRSLPLLFAAGRSCEIARLNKEALTSYIMILKKFPANPIAARVTPIVRRMKLVGKPPKVLGPTVDGDQVNIDDMLGKVVLVVFWSSQAEPFQELLPRLMPVLKSSSRKGLQVVGVNLDQESAQMQQFAAKHKINWPQIFFPDAEQRGWNNPIAVRYGIMDLPALWLVDKAGNVVSTTVKVDKLGVEVDNLLGSE
jgi:peroxiredoxin